MVPSLASTVQEAQVTGRFPDEGSTQSRFSDYAAYNYEIELIGAPTAVVLQWNPNYVEIDPFFLEKYGVEPENGSVIFNMEPGFAYIQFYRKGEPTSWDDLGIRVSER